MHFPYIIERGERLQAEPMTPSGFSKHVLHTREPLLIAENMEPRPSGTGARSLAGEDRSRPCSSRSSPAARRRA